MKRSMKMLLAAVLVLVSSAMAYAAQETFGRGYRADEADRLIAEINSGQREGWKNASKMPDPNRAGNFDVLAERGQTNGRATFQVKISWKTPVDVDLHVTEPDGNKVWYQRLRSPNGGVLLGDDTNGADGRGDATEVYTITGGPSGNYKVAVNLFALRNAPPGTVTDVTVQVTHNPGTPLQRVEPAIIVPLTSPGQTRDATTVQN